MMDDFALRLLQARRVIAAQQAERVRLEQQVRKLTLDLTRAKHIIVGLQRQAQKQPKPRETANA